MQLTAEQVIRYALSVVERYRTEPMQEMRTGNDLMQAMANAPAGANAKSLFFKTVGKKFSWNGLYVEVYTDNWGGIKISCDWNLRHVDCEDGVVFVSINNKSAQLFIHGAWEDSLASICQ